MDTSDPDIVFDDTGVSNHYYDYQKMEAADVLKGQSGQDELQRCFDQIKSEGQGKRFDCILGLSGGVDSTYLCLMVARYGLRPLVVHFDNGWNSELAVFNIQNTVEKLGFTLHTHVVEWQEFRALQLAYFEANVVDIEVLTDHGFMAALYLQAMKHGIRYVLGGMNIVTEGILPNSWIYDKADLDNLCNIYERYGKGRFSDLRTYPKLSSFRRRLMTRVLRLEVVCPLNWVDYVYEDVKKEIADEIGWRDYGGKHRESVFTRFYQGYILPRKFKFDKRRAHLSTLICSGQLTRDAALAEMEASPYTEDELQVDLEFVSKKIGFSEEEFEAYINTAPVPHEYYGGGQQSIYERVPATRFLRPFVDLLFPEKAPKKRLN